MRRSERLIPWLALAALAAPLAAPVASRAAETTLPNRIRIEYVAPTSPEHQAVYEMVKERRALEKLQEIYGAFRLPIDLKLRTAECEGIANAWYQRGRVTVCYEYLVEVRKWMPQQTTPAGVSPVDAVVGQFFYVISHEMGHAVFDLLDVPIFGRPEDAADQFATYIMLQFGIEQARRLIEGAAYSYKRFLERPKVTAPLAAFSDTHSPPATRFYNLACLAYGANSFVFDDFVTKGYLPGQRASGCKREYGEIAYAFKKLIAPHIDQAIAKKVLQKEWLPDPTEKPMPR